MMNLKDKSRYLQEAKSTYRVSLFLWLFRTHLRTVRLAKLGLLGKPYSAFLKASVEEAWLSQDDEDLE